MQLDQKVAIVTGGAGTIGGVIADYLTKAGATVVKWDRDAEPDSETIAVDVSDPASVDAAAAHTVERFGAPQILVNAAGLSGGLARLASDAAGDGDWTAVLSAPSVWETVFNVNVLGVVNTSRTFARIVAEADAKTGLNAGGAIVNITSTSGGPIVDPALAAYSASKAAVNSITKLAAADFGPLGIRVNAVAPGFMETRMKPMPAGAVVANVSTASQDTGTRVASQTPFEGRLGRPEDIAEATVGVLSMGFVTGQVIYVEGGLTLHSLLRG